MKYQRCLVLGGRGFIGSHVVDALLATGTTVRILDRPLPGGVRELPPAANPHLLEVCDGDFNNAKDLDEALAGCDCCIHLITSTLPQTSNDDMVFDISSNLVGTLSLFNALIKHNIKKFVFMSSGGTVYGKPIQDSIDELHPTNPLSSYGVTKLAAEKYLGIFKHLHGLKSVSLRLSNPYGERQRVTGKQGAVAVFLGAAMQGQEIEIWGDGSVVRDYVYIADAIDAILKAIDYDGDEMVFNIGSGRGTSLLEIVASIEAALQRKVPVRFKEARAVDVPRNVLNIERAMKHLGWCPTTSLEDGIARTARWLDFEIRQGLLPHR